MDSDQDYFDCPCCGGTIIAPADVQEVACPHCGERIDLSDEASKEPREADRALDAAKIRQLAQFHRATIRTRSYLLIATCVCVVSVIQCTSMLWIDLRRRQLSIWSAAVLLLLIASCIGAVFFAQKTKRMK